MCSWKLTGNTWNLKKKSTWKIQTVREVSEKSIREKQLPYVKKIKKKCQKNVSRHFFFHVIKKTLSKTLVKSLLKILNKLAPSALAGVGLSLDPKGRKRKAGAHRLFAFGAAMNFLSCLHIISFIHIEGPFWIHFTSLTQSLTSVHSTSLHFSLLLFKKSSQPCKP